jgi:hypothetical protein
VQRPVHLRSVAVVVIAVLLSNVAPASADPINFNQPIQNNVNLKCLEPVGESVDGSVEKSRARPLPRISRAWAGRTVNRG